jgi:hypothetical protein
MHGSSYALMQAALDVNEPTPIAPLRVGLGTTSQTVLLLGSALGLAYGRAVSSRAALFGWKSAEWDAAIEQLKILFAQVKAAIEAERGKEPQVAKALNASLA